MFVYLQKIGMNMKNDIDDKKLQDLIKLLDSQIDNGGCISDSDDDNDSLDDEEVEPS